MNEIENALNDFGEQIVNSLKNSLQNAKPGSQSIADNIQFTIQSTDNGLSLQLSLPDYYKWVDEGRKPGKFPPAQTIANWITGKGIQLSPKNIRAAKSKPISSNAQAKSLAYLIGRKIANEGIPATNFYSSVITDSMINRLQKRLGTAFKQDTLTELSTK